MSAPKDKVHESPLVNSSEAFIPDFAKCHVNVKFRHL